VNSSQSARKVYLNNKLSKGTITPQEKQELDGLTNMDPMNQLIGAALKGKMPQR
jgi:hypothetical protein